MIYGAQEVADVHRRKKEDNRQTVETLAKTYQDEFQMRDFKPLAEVLDKLFLEDIVYEEFAAPASPHVSPAQQASSPQGTRRSERGANMAGVLSHVSMTNANGHASMTGTDPQPEPGVSTASLASPASSAHTSPVIEAENSGSSTSSNIGHASMTSSAKQVKPPSARAKAAFDKLYQPKPEDDEEDTGASTDYMAARRARRNQEKASRTAPMASTRSNRRTATEEQMATDAELALHLHALEQEQPLPNTRYTRGRK